MPEILTESFCERCGTRYTFESAAPRKTRRLGQFKTLSRGVKNWVMSDDSSLDEALAAARSDDEREVTAQQLDAFHSTFNFCMNCRQYTCANCWNPAEGRCLTCAPNLGQEILPAAFPDAGQFEPVRLDAEAWPQVDLPGSANADGLGLAGVPTTNTNGHDHAAEHNGVHELDQPARDEWGVDEIGDGVPDIDAIARLAFLSGEEPPATSPMDGSGSDGPAVDAATAAESAAIDEPSIEAAPAVVAAPAVAPEEAIAAEPPVEAAIEAERPVEAEPAVVGEPGVVGERSVEGDVAGTETSGLAAATEPITAGDDLSDIAEVDERAAELAARTSQLLGRFRPGQNIDAELAAYEAELEARDDQATVTEVEVAATAASPEEMQPQRAARPSDATDLAESAALAPVGDDVVVPPEVAIEASNADVVAPSRADEPAAAPLAAAPEPEPAAAATAESAASEPSPGDATAPREDRIEQPTWRIFAPEQSGGPVVDQPPPQPESPAATPVQASGEPQWPARPEFSESPSMALLAQRARSSSDALWAASTREVLAGPPRNTGPTPVAAPAGIQPCSNCGLSLSANARFCRRCGTRQG